MIKNIDFGKIKKLVINIDMVVGFCEKGALADPGIKRAIPYQIERLEEAKNDPEAEIVFVEEDHDENCEEFNFFPPHCIRGTEECDVVDELKEYEEDAFVIKKNSTSGIFVKDFEELLEAAKNLEKIELQGCCTDLCVMNLAIPLRNYFNQHNRNVDIEVYEETIETYNIPEIHERDEYNKWAFKFMELNGIKVKKIGGK